MSDVLCGLCFPHWTPRGYNPPSVRRLPPHLRLKRQYVRHLLLWEIPALLLLRKHSLLQKTAVDDSQKCRYFYQKWRMPRSLNGSVCGADCFRHSLLWRDRKVGFSVDPPPYLFTTTVLENNNKKSRNLFWIKIGVKLGVLEQAQSSMLPWTVSSHKSKGLWLVLYHSVAEKQSKMPVFYWQFARLPSFAWFLHWCSALLFLLYCNGWCLKSLLTWLQYSGRLAPKAETSEIYNFIKIFFENIWREGSQYYGRWFLDNKWSSH